MNDERKTIALSLISHTNAGKTTLARTLLRRDVGEVLDQPHVTDLSSAYTMVEADEAKLVLWDTPGFGDTARLLRRLEASGNPLGWLLSQVWDRWMDRPLWCSQQAVRNVRDEADLILYLVNASENPGDCAYVPMEMEILSWIGKPVLVLLNQLGAPQGPEFERAEEEKWRQHLERFPQVKRVLSLDAFARCWVQEGELIEEIGIHLPSEKQEAYEALSAMWRGTNLEIFRESMEVLARQLAETCCDREVLRRESILAKARLPRLPEFSHADEGVGKREAMRRLAERLDERIQGSTSELIRIHGLEGKAAGEVLKQLKEDFHVREPVSEGFTAAIGGMVSGALGGLVADLAAGGLTFGGGALIGGILGALGAGTAAKAYNIVRGDGDPQMRWSPELFASLVAAALVRYLAVAHFGRGRGRFHERAHPRIWQETVAAIAEAHRETIRTIWERGGKARAETLQRELEPVLMECGVEVLERLYPEARGISDLKSEI